MLDFLLRVMDIIERVRTASAVSDIAMVGFGILLVFGFINCILGYRLLRFWMMIFGFVIGAGLGLGAAFTMGGGDTLTLIAAAVGVGIVLAVIAFLSYKVGIFVLGAGLGLGVGVYMLHPTTSLMFFICILLGVLLGSLAMKWAREVIIIGTSILGGAMAGLSLAKISKLPDIPYGIVLSIAFALLGMLIQFATNRRKYDDYGDEEENEEERKYVRRAPEQDGYDDYDRSGKRERKEDRTQNGRHDRKTEHERSRFRSKSPEYREKERYVPRVDYRLDDPAPEYEKTVEFRPRRKKKELDLPLDSFDLDDDYRYEKKAGTEVEYDPYEDEEEPIDEELLDEEILKEMMEEEDRKTDLFWKKISGRKNREKNHGKRGKN